MHPHPSRGRGLLAALVLLLLLAVPGVAHAYAVTATPSAASVHAGDTFTLTITTDGSADLRAYQLVYQFDPARLQFMGAAPGGLATGAACGQFSSTTADFAAPADSVIYDVGLLGCGVNGAGDLAVLTFKALAQGNANVDCRLVDFRSSANVSTFPACSGTTTMPVAFTILASAGTGGSISPNGTVYVLPGANQAFTISPTALYAIAGVDVDGAGQGAIASYTFTNVSANHTIAATFAYLPVTDLNNGLRYPTIQAAVSAATTLNGHTLSCGAATFNERVTVTKELTIKGATRPTTIVDGTGLAGAGSGFTVSAGVKNVTIRDLTVQNFAGTSPNSYAGVYAALSNDNLTVRNVTIRNNVGGSGFYANGPVDGVMLDNLEVSGHPNTFGAARGIVIWNGLKQNVTIQNCNVHDNNCCGVELQDGTASGVTLLNNSIHDNGDNGIGIVGLQGPGENLISTNTVMNNGRFGIEVKNPDGSGAATGAGRIVVENNVVQRTVGIGAELRDIAGIAVYRRACLPGNADVPNGTVVRNNSVSGYLQPSASDGFGIVAEGTNHTITGNTVTGCDVGIQRQYGHLPYGAPQSPPVDGDQSNVADTYFGRGNAQVACNISVSANTLGNTLNARDVPATLDTKFLTVNVSGPGTVTKSPDLASYSCGATVTLTAVPTGDNYFAGWSGAASGTTNPVTITMDGDKTVTATFAANVHHAITLQRPRDAASAMASDNAQQNTGYGAWYYVKPGMASKAEMYLDPALDLGAAAFTVADIASIQYHTYNIANPAPVEFGAYLYTTGTAHSWYGERLQAEPYFKQGGFTPVQNAWSAWTSQGASALTWNDTNNSGNQGYYGQPTLTTLQAGPFTWPGTSQTRDYGPMAVKYLSFQTGSGWTSFNGYIDGISIALKDGNVYDVDLEATPYTLALTSGGNGTVAASPAPITLTLPPAFSATGYAHGTVVALTATPAVGYHFASWGGDASGSTSPYSLTMTKDMTVTATFAIDQFTITATAGTGGSIAPAGATVVNYGGAQAYTITADPCYDVADVVVDGVSHLGAVTSYTFTGVVSSRTIDATFVLRTYTITASAAPGGTISPTGAVVVNCGASQAFTAGADACHHVTDVVLDGTTHLGAVAGYTFTNVTGPHTIAVDVAPNDVAPALATHLTATQVRTGNDADGTTKITLGWTPPSDGSTVQVWRAGFGNYPEYGNGPAPGQVPVYPSVGTWTLTGVTAPGQTDEPPARDFWYYAAVSVSSCGVTATGPTTSGTLDYHLGDVSDGVTSCQGDNRIDTRDVSLLGSYYGLTLTDPPTLGGAPNCLDVGPTTTHYIDGRPLPDNHIDFEDLVMFAINYYNPPAGPSVVRGAVAKASSASGIGLAVDAAPPVGGTFHAALVFHSGGDVQALSALLAYDHEVVEMVGVESGELLAQQAGPAQAFTGGGRVDVAVFGNGLTLAGDGALARVTFVVKAAGDPKVSLGDVLARNAQNQPVTLARILATDPAKLPKAIELATGYPNPFTRTTTLVLGLPKASAVRIGVYDIAGRAVATLLDGVSEAGWSRVTWDGRSVTGTRAAPGAYLVRMDVDGRTFTKRIVMVR